MIVAMELKLAAQVATLDSRVDAVRTEAQGNRVDIETMVTCLKVDIATARADVARHVAEVHSLEAVVK